MTADGKSMMLLRIEEGHGQFRSRDGAYHDIDKITKDDLLWIVERLLDASGELEPFDNEAIKNEAHKVVYKSLYTNLKALEDRRQGFIDESERLYLEDYKRYLEDGTQQSTAETTSK